MKLYTLIENISRIPNIFSEHGLSLYFEKDNLRLIVDTGQSNKFIANARLMGIDPESADAIIISHNHYDHIGGLGALLDINSKARVFIRKAAFQRDYMRLSVNSKQLSLPKQEFRAHRERFLLTELYTELSPSIALMSVPRADARYICRDNELYMGREGAYVRDDYSHEQSVLIRESGGINIISPCSHAGIINIINRARNITGAEILNVVGGLHMQARGGGINSDIAFVEETAAFLLKNVKGRVYTGHCTGREAYELLEAEMGDKVRYAYSGECIEL